MRLAYALLTLATVATLMAGCTPGAGAQAPPAAYSVGVAYHESAGHLLLFGGYLEGGYFGATWTWDGRGWTRRETSGPGERNAPALAYDRARERTVLFGGDTRATGALGDTWEWDGTTWHQRADSGPPARSTHALVYDAGRERVVLFGGAAGERLFGDTWEWDGRGWTLVSSEGPSARTLHGLAYDAARSRIVLFGGTSALRPDAPLHGDTWEWDGATWTPIDVPGPSPRDHLAMAFDPERRVVVLHGGGAGPETRETWTYDGSAWTLVSTAGPGRRFARLAFDPSVGRMLLYGGFERGPSNELWSWDGSRWELLPQDPGGR